MKIIGYCSSENVKYLDFFSQLYFNCELSNRTALMVSAPKESSFKNFM